MHFQGWPGLGPGFQLQTLPEGRLMAGPGWLNPAGAWDGPLDAWPASWLSRLASAAQASALQMVGATLTLDACSGPTFMSCSEATLSQPRTCANESGRGCFPQYNPDA